MKRGRDRAYASWRSMVYRCTNPKNPKYRFYGGRGIAICDRWRVFNDFYADMGDRPEGMTLDRIDSDGNYEPGNCRWADAETQANNTRATRVLTFNGEALSISQWSRRLGLGFTTIAGRLKTGWPVALALSEPASKKQRLFRADNEEQSYLSTMRCA